MFKCPSEWKSDTYDPWDLKYTERSTYYFKFALQCWAYEMKKPVKESSVKYPKRAVMLYEDAWHANLETPFLWQMPAEPYAPFLRVNCIYLDGHVRKYAVYYNSVGRDYDANWYFFKGPNDIPVGSGDSHCDLSTGVHDLQ